MGQTTTSGSEKFCIPHNRVVAAWGQHGKYRGRDSVVLHNLRESGIRVTCLGNRPKHPLYIRADQPFVNFSDEGLRLRWEEVMSFTDQKPRRATDKELKANWGGGKSGQRFRCYLCGYKFKLNDYWRWIYGGTVHLCNCMVCEKCDGPNVLEKWQALNQEAREKFWWFTEEAD